MKIVARHRSLASQKRTHGRRAAKIVVGPVTIAQDMRLRGIIAGDATVVTGAHLDLDGTVDGNLTIEQATAS